MHRRQPLNLAESLAYSFPYTQPRFRSMWERYCRGVQAIVYVVDAADYDNLESARLELAELLGKPSLQVTLALQ